MRESDIVRTITIRHKVEGVSEAVAGNKAIAASHDQLAASQTKQATASETSARREASSLRSFELMERRGNSLRKAIDELNKAQALSQRTFDQGSISYDRATAALQPFIDRANKAREAQEKLNAAQAAAKLVTQNRINDVTGVSSMANRNPAGRAEDIAAYGKELDRIREKFNPLFAVGQQYRRTVEEINHASRSGAISEKERAAAMEMAKTTVQNQAKALREGATAGRLMSGEMANLSFQLNDVVTGLALGQSPFMIMAQQGGQVYQILANSKAGVGGAIKEIGSNLRALVTPANVALAGLAAIGVGALTIANNWAEAEKQIDQALIGIGRRSGETRQSINKFANDNSSLAGLSVAEARGVAVEFAKTGNLAASSLKGVSDAVRGYSILTGKDATEATKDLATALSGDLFAAAMKVDSVYGVMDARTLEHVRTLEVQGKRTEAIQLIIDKMAPANQKAADSVGFLSKAYTVLGNAISMAFDGARSDTMTPQDNLNEAVRRRDEFPGSTIGRNERGELQVFGSESEKADYFTRSIEAAQRALDAFNTSQAAEQLTKLSGEITKIGETVLPQLSGLAQLEIAIRKVDEARSKGVAGSNSEGILTVLQHQKSLLQDSLQTTIRQATVVGQLRQEFGGVSAQTALALNNLRGELSIAQAVTGTAQMKAQYMATYNNLLAQGVASQEAMNIAAQQEVVARAAATAAVERQVQSLKDQNAMLKAQQNGTEATTAAAIAYRNAIDSGADATAAAALKAETLKHHLLQASDAAASIQIDLDWSEFEAYNSAITARQRDPANASYFNAPNEMSNGEFFIPNPLLLSNMRRGLGGSDSELAFGGGAFLEAFMQAAIEELDRDRYKDQYDDFKFSGTDADIRGALNVRANELLGSESRDDRLQGMQMQLDALNSLYPTQTRLAEIDALKRAMENLRNSVDENTEALNKVALNPLYNGRDALRVGYMGAASGLDMMVKGGIPGVDSVPIHIMAQQGERLRVDPVGSVSNDNSKSTVVNMYNYFGGSGSSSRRSDRSMVQRYAQQLASVG
jgi:hypothetical protein